MTTPRSIPSGDRPDFIVKCNGTELASTAHILLLEVHAEFNRIASARIVLSDGEVSAEDFQWSSSEHFIPGVEIEIEIGYGGEKETVFQGVVLRQKIRSTGHGSALEVLCKHPAYRLLTSEKFNVFSDSTDSDAIQSIVNSYNRTIDIPATEVIHENLVQYKISDWDFIVNRAEANSMVIIPNGLDLKAVNPQVAGTSVLNLQYGATILDFEAELDGLQQEAQVWSHGWDPENHERIEFESELSDLATAGDLSSGRLANDLELANEQYHYSAVFAQQEVEALAKAEQLRRRLSKIKARMRIQGNAACVPGATVELNGLGSRFNGKMLVSGVKHSFKNGSWTTFLQLGMDHQSHLERFKPMPKSTFALPRGQGLEIAVVVDLDDPEGKYRVKVQFQSLQDETGVWARVAQVDAGQGHTLFFRPELDDEVIVGFINDDPRMPVILGSLHSSYYPSPIDQDNDNHKKGIVTRSEMKFIFDDDRKEITVETPAGNTIVLSDDAGGIRLECQNGNRVELNSDGIILNSASNIEISASGDVSINGTNITASANGQFRADGSSGSELSSGASTTIRGSVVQIN